MRGLHRAERGVVCGLRVGRGVGEPQERKDPPGGRTQPDGGGEDGFGGKCFASEILNPGKR